jgi:hypothetical protein
MSEVRNVGWRPWASWVGGRGGGWCRQPPPGARTVPVSGGLVAQRLVYSPVRSPGEGQLPRTENAAIVADATAHRVSVPKEVGCADRGDQRDGLGAGNQGDGGGRVCLSVLRYTQRPAVGVSLGQDEGHERDSGPVAIGIDYSL